jgi:SMC interacting uncharacterized protein involved in chromosome segregation
LSKRFSSARNKLQIQEKEYRGVIEFLRSTIKDLKSSLEKKDAEYQSLHDAGERFMLLHEELDAANEEIDRLRRMNSEALV